MAKVRVVIDGREASGKEGMTILEAAEQMGMHIPTLCHKPELSPYGGCRICLVEVEDSPRLVASCHTPIANEMVVQTRTPKVLAARKVALELLLTGHTGPCEMDREAKNCELHKLAAELMVTKNRRFIIHLNWLNTALEDGDNIEIRNLVSGG